MLKCACARGGKVGVGVVCLLLSEVVNDYRWGFSDVSVVVVAVAL